jgi:hypothetical protein
MTGTAMTEAAELMQIYKLGVIPIPTNRPMQRLDQADLIYKTEFFLQNVIRKTLYIPCGEDHCGINDQIAYGNFDSMERYCNIFDNTIFLLESKLSIPHPESLHHANIKYNNLQVTRFFLDYVIDR